MREQGADEVTFHQGLPKLMSLGTCLSFCIFFLKAQDDGTSVCQSSSLLIRSRGSFFFFSKCIVLPMLIFKGMLVPGHGNESAGTHRGSSLGQGMRQDNQGWCLSSN